MPRTDQPRKGPKFASQVNAEAVAIVALRALMHTITDHDTPLAIRERIRDLIAVKSAFLGIDPSELDTALDSPDDVVATTNAELKKALRHARQVQP